MATLFILNDPPYGTERSYNGLRLAMALLRREPPAEITLFLLGDAVACAHSGQKPPKGYYNLEKMVEAVSRKGRVLLCGSCMDARGLEEKQIITGCRRSSMDELATCTVDAERVLVF
ncbi:DsrE/DsrF/TusD sulfur relay family protein [Thiohalomonas denitrificans]|uniref:DsrE/DsrF/TusD sulfur relay family protein n=1 Tax=Thiohalomonas denitrificans TaxID=415747 RepID=UPI0026F0C05C|nr:DsrE family protein [Thiohalomonas denitrificans]